MALYLSNLPDRPARKIKRMIFGLIPSTLRMATPLGFAALGGVYSERAGIINLALEGMMLMGAFGYVIGTQASGSVWIRTTRRHRFRISVSAHYTLSLRSLFMLNRLLQGSVSIF